MGNKKSSKQNPILILLGSLIIFSSPLGCKKHPVAPPPKESKVRTLGDSVFYVSSPVNKKIDLDNDGILDVAFYRSFNAHHNYSTDTMGITPLHNEVAIGIASKDFYANRDTILCDINGTLISRYNQYMVDTPSDITYPATYAVFQSNATNIPSFATGGMAAMVLTTSYYQDTPAGTCPLTTYRTYIGNAVGSNQNCFFMLKGKKYVLNMSDKIPYLYFHFVEEL